MVDEAAGLALVYNGELYNFESLKAELEEQGALFTSHSDTEVLLRAWQHWGDACLTRLRGMFAFAVWDMRAHRIFLARDHIGIKPLYYGFTRVGDLVFASELKGLMAHPDVERKLDPQALEDYLALGYVPDPKSIYRGICKLPPGHWLSWQAGEPAPAPRQYWDLPFEIDESVTVDEATARLRVLLDESVASQMVADVPLGAFLSGGVDSSAVVASMSRAVARSRSTPVRSALTTAPIDETGLCASGRRASAHEPLSKSTSARRITICWIRLPASTTSHLRTVPRCPPGGYANWRASTSRWRCRVMAATRISPVTAATPACVGKRLRARLPSGLRKPLFGLLGSVYPKADWAPRPLRAKTTLQGLARDDVEAYFHSVSTTSSAMRQTALQPVIQARIAGIQRAQRISRACQTRAAPTIRCCLAQYLDFKTWLPGDILTKVDRASMAHSLEVRVPVLDHRLVEWASSLPPELKLRRGEGKFIFKKMLEPDLPHEVLYRAKMGFSVPLGRLVPRPAGDTTATALLKGALARVRLFRAGRRRRMVRQHVAGQRDHSATLWKLLMLDSFLRRMQQPATAALSEDPVQQGSRRRATP